MTLVIATSGEQVQLQGGHVDILYDDEGWAAIAEPGRESIWLKDLLQYHIGESADGRRFIQAVDSDESSFLRDVQGEFDHAYQSLHFGAGGVHNIKIYKCNVPLDGLQLFVQIRDLQDSGGYTLHNTQLYISRYTCNI